MNKKNLVNLKDYVNERLLLEQFGKLYDCQPGYGYNPFTKQCYQIPTGIDLGDFDLLSRPKDIVSPLDKDDDSTIIEDISDGWLDFAEMIQENPIEVYNDCYAGSPYTFLAGIFTGTGLTRFFGKGILKSVLFPIKRPILTAVATKPMIAAGALGALVVAVGYAAALFATKVAVDKTFDKNSTDFDSVKDAVDLALKANENGLNMQKWSGDDLARAQGLMVAAGEKQPEEQKYGAAACFAYAMFTSWAMKKGATKLTRAGWGKFVTSNKTVQNSLKSVIDTRKAANTSAFISLASINMLPKKAGKIKVVSEGDEVYFKLAGVKKENIKINIAAAPAAFKKQHSNLIRGDELFLDTQKIRSELRDVSEDVIRQSTRVFNEQGEEAIKKNGLLKDLKRISKILARGGSMSKSALADGYFKATTKVLKQVGKSSEPQMIEMARLDKVAQKLRPRTVGNDDLLKAHQEIRSGSSIRAVATEYKVSEEYLQAFKRYSRVEEQLYKKFSYVEAVLKDEARFVKKNTGGKTPSLRRWFCSSGACRAEKGPVVAALDGIKQRAEDLGEFVSSDLLKSLNWIVYGSLAYGSYEFALKPMTKEIREEASLAAIIKSSDKFFDEIVSKDYDSYLKPNTRQESLINTDKLINDFAAYHEAEADLSKRKEKRSVQVVQDLVRESIASTAVDNHFNGSSTQRGSWEELKEDFTDFLVRKLGDTDDDMLPQIYDNNKKITKEVKEMSKLDIRELVREVLNENSGQGYSKYPYGSSVRDDEEPKEDYMEEWKALSIEVIRDESRNTAIEIAKILVKDLELFEDVLDLAGQNQSIGTEILTKLKRSKEKA